MIGDFGGDGVAVEVKSCQIQDYGGMIHGSCECLPVGHCSLTRVA